MIGKGEIRITYRNGPCVCPSHSFEVEDSVTIERVTPGTYTINVATINCGDETVAGSTTFTLDQAELIPTLDRRSIAGLAVLLAIAALWRLRA